jgi:hypothetical protein
MIFTIKNNRENITNIIRKIGYYSQNDSFIKPLERGGYPRFHLYIKEENDKLIFNLHLDQKKPVYKTVTDHAGEYEGTIIENEAQRIKQIL